MINITMSKEDSKLLRRVLMSYCGDNRPVGKYGGKTVISPIFKYGGTSTNKPPVTEQEWERLAKLVDALYPKKIVGV